MDPQFIAGYTSWGGNKKWKSLAINALHVNKRRRNILYFNSLRLIKQNHEKFTTSISHEKGSGTVPSLAVASYRWHT